MGGGGEKGDRGKGATSQATSDACDDATTEGTSGGHAHGGRAHGDRRHGGDDSDDRSSGASIHQNDGDDHRGDDSDGRSSGASIHQNDGDDHRGDDASCHNGQTALSLLRLLRPLRHHRILEGYPPIVLEASSNTAMPSAGMKPLHLPLQLNQPPQC
jgi:hypothetical protein